jgi:hypothetical protein
MSQALERLRRLTPPCAEGGAGAAGSPNPQALLEFRKSGVAFASLDEPAESAHRAAAGILLSSFMESPSGRTMLVEGHDYMGCWLESTGSACAQALSRFCPGLAESTFLSFADSARHDGLIPYKLVKAGPAYRQVQMATPLARSVWEHFKLSGAGPGFLEAMYRAMSANDSWLARHRDSRGSGCVEAFCAFDTGHDLSPRFWQLPDTCYREDPARYDPDCPSLPFLAPDLTANVHCQRVHLSLMAAQLGLQEESREWERKSRDSLSSLMRECYDAQDGFFYDRDALGRQVRVQSDVLLRVLCCGVGDDAFFARSLERYLLNPRKFFAKQPFTSIALDDPRFDPSCDRNSWAGPTNFLSLLRAPQAFEDHGRRVELQFAMDPVLRSLPGYTRFSQCLDPWSGREGYGSAYVPAVLCVLDFVERSRGILPLAGGGLRFSSAGSDSCAYSRSSGGALFELDNGPDMARAYKDGMEMFSYPRGLCVETDPSGRVIRVAGVAPRRLQGSLSFDGRSLHLDIDGNEVQELRGAGFQTIRPGGFVMPPC